MKKYLISLLLGAITTISIAEEKSPSFQLNLECMPVQQIDTFLERSNEEVIMTMITHRVDATGQPHAHKTLMTMNVETRKWTLLELYEERWLCGAAYGGEIRVYSK